MQRRSWESLRREIEARDEEIARLEAEIRHLSVDLNLRRRLQGQGAAARGSEEGQERLSISREEARDFRAMSHAKGVPLYFWVSVTRFESLYLCLCVCRL